MDRLLGKILIHVLKAANQVKKYFIALEVGLHVREISHSSSVNVPFIMLYCYSGGLTCKELLAFSGDGSGSSATSSKTNNPGMSSLTILGLQLTVPPLKTMSFFSDKKEVQRSATALGYVAHVSSIL